MISVTAAVARSIARMLLFEPSGEVDVGEPKQIKPGAVEEITAPYGIGVHLVGAKSAAAAATDTNGGHVWISSSCTGVGSSDDPKADPRKIDKELREKIERMTKGTAPAESGAKDGGAKDGEAAK